MWMHTECITAAAARQTREKSDYSRYNELHYSTTDHVRHYSVIDLCVIVFPELGVKHLP